MEAQCKTCLLWEQFTFTDRNDVKTFGTGQVGRCTRVIDEHNHPDEGIATDLSDEPAILRIEGYAAETARAVLLTRETFGCNEFEWDGKIYMDDKLVAISKKRKKTNG